MRVGVIRADLPGPLFIDDVEAVSRYNPPTEPRGQERYVSRPTVEELEGVLANSVTGAGATLNGSNITGSLPLLIDGTNNALKLRTTAAPTAFTTVLIPQATYATLALLAAAVNSATSAVGVQGRVNAAGNGIALESSTRGVNSFLENDTVAGGSTANTALGLANGAIRTMPTAATYITALLPVGGPLDVSTATINGVGAGTASTALALIPTSRGATAAVADAVAPRYDESSVAVNSFLLGDIAGYRSATFTPDPSRLPPLALGAAVTVVADDGTTPFVATLPVITLADLNTPGAGDLTISGTGLGSSERNETTVHLTDATTGYRKTLLQQLIVAGGGTVTATSIFIPAALIPGAALTTTSAQVKVRQQVSGLSVLT